MELNEMEKKLLFQVEGDYQTKILNELYMTVRYSNNSEQREAAEGLMAKLRVLSNAECMDLVKDITFVIPRKVRAAGMWQSLKLLLMRFPMRHFKSWRDGNGMVIACLWAVLPMWR